MFASVNSYETAPVSHPGPEGPELDVRLVLASFSEPPPLEGGLDLVTSRQDAI